MDETLKDVKQKFVRLYRQDPPPLIVPMPREPLAPILDRWVAKRFTLDEVAVLMKLEHERGSAAVTTWFDSVLDEVRLAS
ncbi:MAG: hypothetical protein QM704_19820 [Anaeromyxobacteraceae bacterium]